MSIENVTEIETWVDPFTSDLFFNANHDSYDALEDDATSDEVFEAFFKMLKSLSK